MRITKHISFFYIESRICYINNIINETNKYECPTDIYIHTNDEKVTDSVFTTYNNGLLKIIHHDLSNENPFYLTWKCRDLLEKQKNDYDIFMYIEDDILVPYKAIQYWLDYNEKLIEHGYNLGFLRIEFNKHKAEFLPDFDGRRMCKINKFIKLDDTEYAVNEMFPYCAFWIYNKKEFNRFVSSKFYDIRNISGYKIRESSAIGLHGISTEWYKNTLIPIIDNKLIDCCKIYHMPNNYVNMPKTFYGKTRFIDIIKKCDVLK